MSSAVYKCELLPISGFEETMQFLKSTGWTHNECLDSISVRVELAVKPVLFEQLAGEMGSHTTNIVRISAAGILFDLIADERMQDALVFVPMHNVICIGN